MRLNQDNLLSTLDDRMDNFTKSNSSKVNIRFLVNETLHKGTFIDRKIDGSNTLLHLAVEYDLADCVVKLLSSGASSRLTNSLGLTAKDIALNNGNQNLIQILGRREDYGNHLQHCGSQHSTQSEQKILPLTIGAVYEDYFDWTDTKRCQRLKVCGTCLDVFIGDCSDRN